MTSTYLLLPKTSDLIEFNCLGTIFIIRESSLNRFPDTLLGNPQSRAKFFHKTRQQYIVDRHIVSFEAIIYYYETGKLIAPTIYEPIIFFEELKYFQFDEETIQQFYQTEIHEELFYHERIVPSNKLFRAIWIALEYQDYSFLTQLIHFICLMVSLIYCFVISAELIPQLSRDKMICYRSQTHGPSNVCDHRFFDFRPSKIRALWLLRIEHVCTIWMTFEYFLRLLVSPHKWSTLTSLMNIFDLLILFASWTYLILVDMNIYHDDLYDPFFYIKLFQYLCIIRLFRFVRLCRYVKCLRILFHGVEQAAKEIFSIGFIILFFVFTFGVSIQVIEKNWDHSFVTRLEDLFNIVTISTITVGDAKRVPLSAIGKFLCSFLAGIGLIGISLPLPSIYRTFQGIYREENMDRTFRNTKYITTDGRTIR